MLASNCSLQWPLEFTITRRDHHLHSLLHSRPPADFAADPRYQPRVLSPGAQERQILREEQVGAGVPVLVAPTFV